MWTVPYYTHLHFSLQPHMVNYPQNPSRSPESSMFSSWVQAGGNSTWIYKSSCFVRLVDFEGKKELAQGGVARLNEVSEPSVTSQRAKIQSAFVVGFFSEKWNKQNKSSLGFLISEGLTDKPNNTTGKRLLPAICILDKCFVWLEHRLQHSCTK